jgi:hypothetical protein
VGLGLSNNTSPFFPIYHHLSPFSHFQHLKIFFHFFSSSIPGFSSSSRHFQFLGEDIFGHPINICNGNVNVFDFAQLTFVEYRHFFAISNHLGLI